MSVATPPPPGTAPQEPAEERCPLCGAPLGAEQDWCLRCGAAARTRLAATPRWRPPVIALATVVVLSLGALTAALVSLAGSSGQGGTVAVTRTVTAPTAGATTTPGAAAGAAGTTTGVPGASTTGTTAAGASTTGAVGTTAPKTGGGTTTAPAGASGVAGSATTAPSATHTGASTGASTTDSSTTGASTTGAAGAGSGEAKSTTKKTKNPLEKVIQAYERRHG